jgi:hypothetical protein
MRLPSIILLAMLAACGGDDDGGGGGGGGGGGSDGGGGGDGERGPVAIADLEGSCADTDCDGSGSGNCYCDTDCSFYGDCCDDYWMACSDGVSCGGLVGDRCDRPTFCHFAPSDACGTGDQIGVCTRPATDCTDESLPVCGCDTNTYDNRCLAEMAGTSVAADGPCR